MRCASSPNIHSCSPHTPPTRSSDTPQLPSNSPFQPKSQVQDHPGVGPEASLQEVRTSTFLHCGPTFCTCSANPYFPPHAVHMLLRCCYPVLARATIQPCFRSSHRPLLSRCKPPPLFSSSPRPLTLTRLPPRTPCQRPHAVPTLSQCLCPRGGSVHGGPEVRCRGVQGAHSDERHHHERYASGVSEGFLSRWTCREKREEGNSKTLTLPWGRPRREHRAHRMRAGGEEKE